MVRPKRVLSFMSEWGNNVPGRRNTASATTSPAPLSPSTKPNNPSATFSHSSTTTLESPAASPAPQPRSDTRPSSRPMSMIQTYQPPVMDVSQDTLPELHPIFTFMNSHSNKLYQEGYFLKFHDTDYRGRPAPDRAWQECFAQLVGTILSLWDASELDQASGDSEVLPTFINLTDAAIHMMPSMTLNDGKRLDNILIVSTAGSNKYLFHFNSFNSMCQWTAGIRLAMFEHTSLQELYTGSLIAGRGKTVNNMRTIMDRKCAGYDDWVRVRFGAGTPWRRCWCVVTPPDEKEYAKLQKVSKKNVYDRSPTVLKGDLKFYDTKKVTKKTRPIATVKEAYACYAIYPQSKPLIDQSTLVKLEGKITIHSKPESTMDGFVFVMPESRPAVSGFEVMTQFLFPVFDTFALYGRPKALIASDLDSRGLMFAMPAGRRYGYLEMWDVVGLIHQEGSQPWDERTWRKQLKDLTSARMTDGPSRGQSKSSRRNTVGRASLPPSRSGTIRFEDRGSIRSQPSTRRSSPTRSGEAVPQIPQRVDSAPPTGSFATPRHQRSVSEHVNGYKQYPNTSSHLAKGRSVDDNDIPPSPPPHAQFSATPQRNDGYETEDGEQPSPGARSLPEVQMPPTDPPSGPVESPPSFAHAPGQRPPVQPYFPPQTKPTAQMDSATLDQMADATNTSASVGAAWGSQENLSGRRSGDYESRGDEGNPMLLNANARGFPGDPYHSSSGPHSGQPGSRLPTIPASPYVEHSEFVESPVVYQPAPPAVPEHAELPQQPQPGEEPVDPPRSGSGSSQHQIQRKPVPGRSSQSLRRDDTRSTTSSSLGSLRNDVIDPEALDSLNYTDTLLQRQFSASSSRYDDDGVSTSTPDYASAVSEEVQARRVPPARADRPRSGVLKVVGDPALNPKSEFVVGDAHYKPEAKPAQVSSDVPTIDFGPTYHLDPDRRPGTSGTIMTQGYMEGNFSRSRDNLSASPSEQNRQSFISGRATPNAATHTRSASASPKQFGDGRSVAWQPALGSPSQEQSNRRKLDPDEWVAQRASAAQQTRYSPVNAHGRSKSHTPPPFGGGHSGDWSHLQRTPEGEPSRPPSRPLSRPLSRGAGGLLDQRPSALSAREQEQVARMTNTPLIDLTRKSGKEKEQRPSSAGLTAYIDYREKEKAAAKSNRNTAAMQAEVDRRMMAAQQRQFAEMQQMQHMSHQQQQMAMQGGFAGTPTMMGAPQYAPQAFAYSSPGQMQQMYQQQQGGYFPPQGAMTPNMQMQQGWATPSPTMSQMQQGYFGQPNMGQQSMQHSMGGAMRQQQQPMLQPYGASFDAQQAARYAQQGQHRRM